MFRVGVTIKQIENEHLQNMLVFWAWIIWGGTKNIWGALPPNVPRGYGTACGAVFLMFCQKYVFSDKVWKLFKGVKLIRAPWLCHKYFEKHILKNNYISISNVRRKFPRERPSFVTIVWRHKSTLRKCRRHDHSRGVRGHAPGKFCKITPKNTHFCAFWKQVLDNTIFAFFYF